MRQSFLVHFAKLAMRGKKFYTDLGMFYDNHTLLDAMVAYFGVTVERSGQAP